MGAIIFASTFRFPLFSATFSNQLGGLQKIFVHFDVQALNDVDRANRERQEKAERGRGMAERSEREEQR